MKNARGEITIDGLYDDVLPPTEMDRVAMAALPLDVERLKANLGLTALDEPLDRPFYERLMFQPTLTINGLHGGYGGAGSKTVLPHEAIAKCDMRLVEAQRAEDVLAKIAAHVKKHAPDVEFITEAGMEPERTPLESRFTEPIRAAIIAAQGNAPLLIPSAGGSVPDYVFTKILRIPAFGVPYANHDEANHAPNENMMLDRFISGIKTGAAMLTYLGSHTNP